MPKRIAGEIIEREVPSREGIVYITSRYVYKVFGGRTNPYDELGKYKAAEGRGVPVPSTAKFTAQLQDGSRTEDVGGLRSTKASGRFFQLSKPGGESILINEINRMTNRELIKVVIKGLQSAGEIGVTDPQGFVAINSNPPLTFIDLHYRGSPSPITFQAVINAAERRLEQLG